MLLDISKFVRSGNSERRRDEDTKSKVVARCQLAHHPTAAVTAPLRPLRHSSRKYRTDILKWLLLRVRDGSSYSWMLWVFIMFQVNNT